MTTAKPDTASSPGALRLGASAALLLSLIGLGVNGYLSTMKFRMNFTPCLSAKGSCAVGGMTCEDALQSTWSTLLGLPITVWGAAFYVVTAALAAGLLARPDFLRGAARPLLLRLAVFDVLVSVVMGAYAFLVLAARCPYCLSLYAISALLLVAAAFCGGDRRQWQDLVRRRQADLLDAVFVVSAIFIVGAGVQSVTYQASRRLVDAQTGCAAPSKALPTTVLRSGPADAKVGVALFLDTTCAYCQREFRNVGRAVLGGDLDVPTQVWVFHVPRHACDPDAFPAGYPLQDANAMNNGACLAARAAECVEKLRPGSGFDMVAGLFALQDDPDPNGGPIFSPVRVGDKAVDIGLEIDPDEPDNALFQCINGDKDALARITEHQRFAVDQGYKVPTGFVFPIVDGAPRIDAVSHIQSDYTARALIAIIRERAQQQAP